MKKGTYKHSEEMKKYLSDKRKGIKFTDVHKLNIKKNHAHSWLGKKHTQEQKNKIGRAHKGKIISEEQRKKISLANKGKYIGEKSPVWKGGKTPTITMIRNMSLYTQWRLNIFRRDNFTCIICGDKKGHNLEADHIKPLSIIVYQNKIKTFDDAEKCNELWNIINGRTLCKKCHKKTDTYGIKALNFINHNVV